MDGFIELKKINFFHNRYFLALEVLTIGKSCGTISNEGCVIAPLTHLSFSRADDYVICSAVLFMSGREYTIDNSIIYRSGNYAREKNG